MDKFAKIANIHKNNNIIKMSLFSGIKVTEVNTIKSVNINKCLFITSSYTTDNIAHILSYDAATIRAEYNMDPMYEIATRLCKNSNYYTGLNPEHLFGISNSLDSGDVKNNKSNKLVILILAGNVFHIKPYCHYKNTEATCFKHNDVKYNFPYSENLIRTENLIYIAVQILEKLKSI